MARVARPRNPRCIPTPPGPPGRRFRLSEQDASQKQLSARLADSLGQGHQDDAPIDEEPSERFTACHGIGCDEVGHLAEALIDLVVGWKAQEPFDTQHLRALIDDRIK